MLISGERERERDREVEERIERERENITYRNAFIHIT